MLKEILAEEGATVPNNAEIAVIETDDEAGGTGAAAAPAATEAQPAADRPRGPSPSSRPTRTPPPRTDPPARTSAPPPAHGHSAPAATAAAPSTAAPAADGDPNARMTPAVRRLLREHGLEASQIAGTGGGGPDHARGRPRLRRGRAHRPDPRRARSGRAGVRVRRRPRPRPRAPPAATNAGITFPAGADEVLVPMTQMRKGIAAQMTRALSAPHAYVQMEIDATKLVRLRESVKKAYQAKEGIGLSFVPFVVKASAEALKKNPTFNAHWTEQGLLAKRRVNIGVAVAVDEGLIVPVIRDADTLSIHGLNVAISDVATRARLNKLRLDDFGGGTFTVDNTGYLGTNLVMPIINVPEVGIVTMEAITKRPVVLSTPDGDTIAIRPVMNMVLGIDHRANDGAGGAALLRDIKAWLESVGPDTAIY